MGSTNRDKSWLEFNDCIAGLALNASSTRVVIGGRRLLKVINLEDGKFGEQLNIRLREQPLLNYNSIDVAWSPHYDNIVASGAANGAVILWDLNKHGRRKIDYLFNAHDRTCNRLSFHATESNLMLSGAQDGKMTLIDIRARTFVQLFDKETPPMSIRDVQFSHLMPNMIAVGYDNGYVETWDMRNTAHWEKQFAAHYGPVFTLDWHPEERHWLATGGRDKIIKVWNVGEAARNGPPIYNLQMIASTARIKWRPMHRFQLGSCAQLMDFSVNIWDVRRPYVAFATFGNHRDIATGFEWLHNDPNHLVSCGKDGMLIFHRYDSSNHPVDNVCPVTARLNPAGHLIHAYNSKLPHVNSSRNAGPVPLQSFFHQRPSERHESHPAAVSLMSQYCPTDVSSDFNVISSDLSMDWFVELARQYKLSGETPSVLCEINAEVASRFKRSDVAHTWRMLGVMVPTIASILSSALVSTAASLPVLLSHPISQQQQQQVPHAPAIQTCTDLSIEAVENSNEAQQQTENHAGQNNNVLTSTGPSDSESGECEEDDTTSSYATSAYIPAKQDMFMSSVSTLMRSLSPTDMMFGDMDFLCNNLGVHFESEAKTQTQDEWQPCNLPTEAFEPRFECDNEDSGTGVVEDVGSDDEESRQHQPFQPFYETTNGTSTNNVKTVEQRRQQQRHVERVVEELPIKQEILSVLPFGSCVPTLDFSKVILSMVRQYASQNDVQMAVSVLLCLGDKYIRLIDQLELEQWFFSYIDLLQQYELFTIAAAIIKQSSAVHEVYDLTRTSTRVNTSCTGCGRPLTKGWLCDRCNGYVHVCSLCHLPVRGLYMWCQGCSHGGHIEHMQSWFSEHTQCPSGCGHECEFT